MDESDFEAEHAAAGRLVDQLGAGVRQLGERGADVLDLVRDVMHPGAALREKAADGRVLAERSQQLEPALADTDGRRLDALLLDARALLDPGAEEASVRVERAVEILDSETDVVHRARRIHLAIVFERLMPSMRVSVVAALLVVALLAGCGGSKQTAPGNGEASKSAAQVFADAQAAATNARTAHVSGSIGPPGSQAKLDLSMVRGSGAKGSMSTKGLPFDVVRIGDTIYIRGSDAFWQHFAGRSLARLVHGTWLKGSATRGRLRAFAAITSLGAIFAGIGSHHGKLVNDGTTTYQGQQVVAIRATNDGSKLYVAATGKPYPVALLAGKGGQFGKVTFGDWNKHVSLSAPSGAIDLSKFGG